MAAVAANQNIESDLIPKIATAFCSGVAQTGGTCGALNGAILGLSMVHGRTGKDNNRELLYKKTQILINSFQEHFEHLTCPELIQLDLGKPGAGEEYQARGLSKQCEQYVRTATQLAVEMLQGA